MRVNFRQGLISYQQDAGTPVYLQPSATASFISHVVSPTPTVATVAHGGSDYLLRFDTSTDLAWQITAPVTAFLYWDIDQLTSNVTRGVTIPIPITSITEPVAPIDDQHWFDLNTNMTKVWSTSRNKWVIKIRLFAGHVVGGNTSTIVMHSGGSQIGLNTPSNPGYIMLDALLQPLKKSSENGEFLTDADMVHVRTTVNTSGVLVQPVSRVVPVRAGQAIPRMSMVYFSADDTIRLASSDPGLIPTRPPVGICIDALASGEIGTLVQTGEISYDQWDWSTIPGAALYSDSYGQLTATRPPGLMAFRVGFVKNKNTVLVMVDSETNPQVYTATTNDLIITGTTPVYTTDVVNGIGERVVTVIVPDVTTLQSGLMTSAQLLSLNSHETRLGTAEFDITALQLNKSNVGHTHITSDVTGLQSALDVLTSAVADKADKIVPALPGNFAALSATGNLEDSGYTTTSFAFASHVHSIPDITSLQTELNQRAYRAHLTAISEVFTTVDRTGTFDVGTAPTLMDLLNGKAAVVHTHGISGVIGLQSALDGKAPILHAHAIADVSNLQTELNNRAFVSHTHTASAITGGTIGYVLSSNGTTGVWTAPTPAFVIGSIDQHTDVDTTTSAPAVSDVLTWDGTNWVPGIVSSVTAIPLYEIAVGTGSNISSSPSFTYKAGNGALSMNDGSTVATPLATIIRAASSSGTGGLGTTAGADLYLSSGQGATGVSGSNSGNIHLTVPNSDGFAGSITLTASNAGSLAGNPNGGDIAIVAGNGYGTGPLVRGGYVSIAAGSAADFNIERGGVVLTAGSGGGEMGQRSLAFNGYGAIGFNTSYNADPAEVIFSANYGIDGYVLRSRGNTNKAEWFAPDFRPSPLRLIEHTLYNTLNVGSAGDHNSLYRVNVATDVTVQVQPDSYNLGAGDWWSTPNAPMPIGGTALFSKSGPGNIIFLAMAGVTINTPETLVVNKLHGKVTLIKIAPNVWELEGNLAPV